MMMLSCPCGHDLETWSSQNPSKSFVDDHKILIMSKFENTKKLIMSNFENHEILIMSDFENQEFLIMSNVENQEILIIWNLDHRILSVCPCRPPPMPPDRKHRGWSTGKPTLKCLPVQQNQSKCLLVQANNRPWAFKIFNRDLKILIS